MPGDDDDRVLTEVSEGHRAAFEALSEDEQWAHLRDTHGANSLPESPGMLLEQHAGSHLNSTVAEAHRLISSLPPGDFTRLLNGSVERNIERVRRGGLNTVVFTDPGDVPLIARVCIGVIEYTDDYRRLYGPLPSRLDRMRSEAQRLHKTLKSAIGWEET